MKKLIKVKIVENGMVFPSLKECAKWISKDRGLSLSGTQSRISHCINGTPSKKLNKYVTKSGEHRVYKSKQYARTVNIYTVRKVE